MTAAVIGASSESIHAIKIAHKLGLKVVAFDGNPQAPGLADADMAYPVDIRFPGKIFNILDQDRPSAVIPVPIGRYLTTTGAVNDRYGTLGVSEKSAILCTDKYCFHNKLNKYGLRGIPVALLPSGLKNAEDIVQLIFGCHLSQSVALHFSEEAVQTQSENTAVQSIPQSSTATQLRSENAATVLPRPQSSTATQLRSENAATVLPRPESLAAIQPCPENAAGVSFPMIIKPRFGSGSRGVVLIRNKEELQREAEAIAPLSEDFIAEACVEGTEYGVDGAFVNGVFHLILLRSKINTPYPYRQCVGYYSVPATKEPVFTETVCRFLQKAGRCLGLVNTLMHADIIRQQDGQPFLIELSARPSGHNLHNLFTPLVTGIDPVEEFLKLSLGTIQPEEAFHTAHSRNMLIRYFDLPEGVVESLPDRQQLAQYPLVRWNCNLKIGDAIKQVTNGASIMGRGYFILEADDEGALMHDADDILHMFRIRS